MPPMKLPFLEIVGPDKQLTRHELVEKAATIGRHPSNVIFLVDDRASRFHCVVEKTPQGYEARDVGSRNGTTLNGVPLDLAVLLQPGDEIRVGDTLLRYVDPMAKDPKPRRQAAQTYTPDPDSPAGRQRHRLTTRF